MPQQPTVAIQDSLNTAITKALDSSSIRRSGVQSIYTEAYLNNPVLTRIIDYKIEKALSLKPLFYPVKKEADEQVNEDLYEALEKIEFITQDSRIVYDWASFWCEALKLADIEGNAYVVIGDGSSSKTTKPLGDNAKVKWLALLDYDSVMWSDARQTYTVHKQSNMVNNDLINRVEFHSSRVIRLYGIRVIGSSRYAYNRDLSVLAPLIDHYSELENCYCNTKEMVKNHSFFVLAKKGLTSLVGSKSETELSERLRGLLAGLKNLGGLLIDKDKEEATVISRNYGGLHDLIQISIDWFVAQTGYPRSFITGISDSASLSDASKSDARLLASCVKSYQYLKYKPAIALISNLKAAELGLPKTDIQFESTYEPDAMEEATIAKIKAETEQILANIAQTNAMVTPEP
jgi:hypothetical protein